MAESSTDITTLNSLTATLIDSVTGFRDAAEHTESTRFQLLFRKFADERSEDYLKKKFETALKDIELSSGTRAVIEQAFTSVRHGHDQMSNLKHGMDA